MGFPFDDHNCPKFDDLGPFCEKLDEFLCQHPENVAAMHCKAGKGRTGLCICVYLLHTGLWKTADECLNFYGVSRTLNQKGVTIPSQRRWVRYYDQWLRLRENGRMPPSTGKKFRVVKFKIGKDAPKFKLVTIYNQDKKVSSAKWGDIWKTDSNGDIWGECPTGPDAMYIYKDVKVQFDNKNMFSKSRAFSFWFNTDFLESNNTLRLEKPEIDKVNKDKKQKKFFVEVTFEVVEDAGLYQEPGQEVKEDDALAVDVEKITPEQLVLALRLQDSINIKNRSWDNDIYKNCFLGNEAVSWMMRACTFRTTQDAIRIGNMMLTESIFKSVLRSDRDINAFVNGPQFYRFNTGVPEYDDT